VEGVNRIALVFVVLALTVRALVPNGWMPDSERAFALTVCTGVDTQTIWMDSKGALHKQNPDEHKQASHEPCAYAGHADVSTPVADVYSDSDLRLLAIRDPIEPLRVAIGLGLAAPPPPQTGPPILT
jgi:hypothetical protein